jgi:hypothetical protein
MLILVVASRSIRSTAAGSQAALLIDDLDTATATYMEKE